jgi:DNA-binding SARP family transcriptional activator/tetratricopeptide (TPR) repeat protein
VEFRVLGVVDAVSGGQQVDLGHARLRCVLAALLVDANRVVSVDQLMERVWGDRPPQRGRNVLYSYLSRLRTAFAAEHDVRIERRPGGYLFTVDETSVDLHRFRGLLTAARLAKEDDQAVVLFDEALHLWRGTPFADLDTPWLAALRTVLEADREAARLDRTDAALRCGQHNQLLADLSAHAAQHPFDERIAGQLMLALAGTGRQAEALTVYRRTRGVLLDELGLEPGPELRELHKRVLDGELVTAARSLTNRRVTPEPLALWHGVPAANPFFTGRADILRRIHDHLHGAAAVRTVGVVPLLGMGGVGKTQLALEYAHRYAGHYRLVCWVNADSAVLATATLIAMAGELGLSIDGPPDAVVAQLWTALATRDDWLLIYDNVEGPAIAAWLQPPESGRLLITGRSPAIGRLSTATIEVAPFHRAESVHLLVQRCARLTAAEAGQVAAAVGDLPLAVEQAGCFLDDSGLAVADYVGLLATQPAHAGLADPTLARHPGLVAVVTAARARLATECPPAGALVDQMAFLAPEPLTITPRPAPAGVQVGDVATTADVVRHLGNLALVRHTGTTLRMHRLVHALLRERARAEGAAETICVQARRLLATAEPGDPNDPATWPSYAALTPHVQALAGHDETVRTGDDEPVLFRTLLINVQRYLYASGQAGVQHALAKATHQRWTAMLGPDDPHTLDAGNSLGLALFEAGEYAAARDLHSDCLRRALRVLGEDHPHTWRARANLGVALFGLGDYPAALELYQGMLDRSRQVRGADHLDTLWAANNVAGALQESGQQQAARVLYEDTLGRCRRVLGHDDPHTLRTASNLVVNLIGLGALVAARELAEDTLERRRRLLGAGNPQALTSAVALVEALTAVGDHQAARALGEETHQRFRQVLGADHPLSLQAAHYLVVALTGLGERQAACELGADTLDRLTRALGAEHPHTRRTAAQLRLAGRVGRDDRVDQDDAGQA